jgi:hypothetical protein
MMLGSLTSCEAAIFELINAISASRVSVRHVICAIARLVGDARHVDQSVILAQGICGKAKDKVTFFGCLADHWFANRQRQETAVDARRSAVICRELVEVDFHISAVQLFAWSKAGACEWNQCRNLSGFSISGNLALRCR